MPKRTDIQHILIIGSGPIVIGQACEFDYSGTQACKALREEGYTITLVNPNPATIMTDPNMAHNTYLEPLNPAFVEQIIKKEKVDALLPTLGGQTALNLALTLHKTGVLKKYEVQLLGANISAIERAESRERFKQIASSLGIKSAASFICHTVEEAIAAAKKIGYPCIVRPSYTLGGKGGGVASDKANLRDIVVQGLNYSLTKEVLIEQSMLGWKEFELELMRDNSDNGIVVCSIENMDPMGVHTGDSITVAPAQTLTDRQYQVMRTAALKLMKAVGVTTGGSNVQFAVNPKNGEMVVIELNPRVSRSSALASKATGYPIAKIAAKLAVGYSLHELNNDITQKNACFEPSIDYCVVKIPRFNFDKFPNESTSLGTSMRAIGEVMGIGRTFKEAYQKAVASLELTVTNITKSVSDKQLSVSTPYRFLYIWQAFKQGYSVAEIYKLSKIDTWFLYQIQQLAKVQQPNLTDIKLLKYWGFSDVQLSELLPTKSVKEIRQYRKQNNCIAAIKQVDTCAGEFKAFVPYFYTTFGEEDEIMVSDKPSVLIVGSGPNRIGQGIEFDYCCVQSILACRYKNIESIMLNTNPETVSTDYDVADKLYFDPITAEYLRIIYEKEQPRGIVVQMGGQTAINIAAEAQKIGFSILGTTYQDMLAAENRATFKQLLDHLAIPQIPSVIINKSSDWKDLATKTTFPFILRSSFVIGGNNMQIVYSREQLQVVLNNSSFTYPVLVEQFLANATELDVDAIADGEQCIVIGIMEHIEPAGIHSGDSACVYPPYTLSQAIQQKVASITQQLAKALNIVGLINVQMVVYNEEVYVIEVNPRASRTLPFLCKAMATNWIAYAMRIILGEKIENLNIIIKKPTLYAIKEVVFPFNRLQNANIELGVNMKSTGEIMCMHSNLAYCFYKAQLAANNKIPLNGTVVVDCHRFFTNECNVLGQQLNALGFKVVFTEKAQSTNKQNDDDTSLLRNANMFISIYPIGLTDKSCLTLRRLAWDKQVCIFTSIPAVKIAIESIRFMQQNDKYIAVSALQQM